MILLLIISVYL